MGRYAAFKIRTSCSHCGNPLILNGPMRAPECPACLNPVEIAPSVWKGLMEDVVEEYHTLQDGQGSSSTMMIGGFTFKLQYYRATPKCLQCKTHMDADSVATGADMPLKCTSCGTAMDSFPAPAWLREKLPAVSQLFGAQREPGNEPSASMTETAEAVRPVVLHCPQCNGTLKITADSDRIVPCSYCDVDVYLPDAIWLRLHPVKVVSDWYVRLEMT